MFRLEMKVNQLGDFKIMISNPTEQAKRKRGSLTVQAPVIPVELINGRDTAMALDQKNSHTFLLVPSLIADAPSVAGAALFPHLNHAGKSLDTRLVSPQHGHLLVSTNIWPVHGKHTKMRNRWTDAKKPII